MARLWMGLKLLSPWLMLTVGVCWRFYNLISQLARASEKERNTLSYLILMDHHNGFEVVWVQQDSNYRRPKQQSVNDCVDGLLLETMRSWQVNKRDKSILNVDSTTPTLSFHHLKFTPQPRGASSQLITQLLDPIGRLHARWETQPRLLNSTSRSPALRSWGYFLSWRGKVKNEAGWAVRTPEVTVSRGGISWTRTTLGISSWTFGFWPLKKRMKDEDTFANTCLDAAGQRPVCMETDRCDSGTDTRPDERKTRNAPEPLPLPLSPSQTLQGQMWPAAHSVFDKHGASLSSLLFLHSVFHCPSSLAFKALMGDCCDTDKNTVEFNWVRGKWNSRWKQSVNL